MADSRAWARIPVYEMILAISRDLERSMGGSFDDLTRVSGGRSAVTFAGSFKPSTGVRINVFVRAARPGGGISLRTPVEQASLFEVTRRHGVLSPRPLHAGSFTTRDGPVDVLVTEEMPGDVPDPWTRGGREALARLRNNQRFRATFVEQLALIHGVQSSELSHTIGIAEPDSAHAYPGKVVDRAVRASQGNPAFRFDPVIKHAIDEAQRRLPSGRHGSGLVHGDFRMGNVLIKDDEFVGILDWELAEPGDVLSDVAWLYGPQAITDGFVGGLFEQAELIEEYEDLTGVAIDSGLLDYYVSLGALRTAAVWVTIASWDGIQAGDPGSMRAAMSAAQMRKVLGEIHQVVDGLHSDPKSSHPGYPPDLAMLMHRGVASLSQSLGKALDPAAELGDRELALRTSQRFLRSLDQLLDTDIFYRYHKQVETTVGDRGVDGWPGRNLHDALAETVSDPRLRGALAMASLPVPAFGDLVCAIGAQLERSDSQGLSVG